MALRRSPIQLLYSMILPIAVFGAALAILFNIEQLEASYRQLFIIAPYLIFSLVIVLALRFRQSRTLSVCLTVAVAYWGVREFLQQPMQEDPLAQYIFTGISLCLPVNILLALVFPERGIRHLLGITLILLVPLEAFILWLGWMNVPGFDLATAFSRFPVFPFEGYVLSVAATIVFEVVLAVAVGFSLWRQSAGSLTFITVAAGSFCYLAWFYVPQISTVLSSASGILLLSLLLTHAYDLAYRDELTGLMGRRALNERLRSPGSNYVIAMIDIDHFKKFNDTYGHDAGDEVLKIVAKQIAKVGGGGIPYRYGGEEFTVLFPGAEREECVEHLEEVRRNIAVYDMTLRDHKSRPKSQKRGATRRGSVSKSKRVRVTISIGVAERGDGLDTAVEVIKAADNALYKAKKLGRNRLV